MQVLKVLSLSDGMSKVFVCKGTEKENLDYVGKEDTRLEGTTGVVLGTPELGDHSGQGKRNDMKKAVEIFMKRGYEGLVAEAPEMIVKFPRGFDKLEEIAGPRRDKSVEPKVFVLWGETRCGKTKLAHELLEKSGLPFYIKNTQTKWFDGYKGEKIVLMDEFVGVNAKANTSLGDILLWCDRYPMSVEVKGGSRKLAASVWVFTSNLNPQHWFSQADEASQAAWRARITGELEWFNGQVRESVQNEAITITNQLLQWRVHGQDVRKVGLRPNAPVEVKLEPGTGKEEVVDLTDE